MRVYGVREMHGEVECEIVDEMADMAEGGGCGGGGGGGERRR